MEVGCGGRLVSDYTWQTTTYDRISDWVREHPEQWFWFHRRWRTTLRSRTEDGD